MLNATWCLKFRLLTNRLVTEMRFKFLSILFTCALAACGSSHTAIDETLVVSPGTAGTISYCRPSSIMRVAEYPTLYVENTPVAQVKNGSIGTVPIALGQNFRFGLKPSALFMRVTEQVAYEGTAEKLKDRFFVVSGKANMKQGLAILGGGIIGAAELDKQQNTGLENWEVREVSKQAFGSECKA